MLNTFFNNRIFLLSYSNDWWARLFLFRSVEVHGHVLPCHRPICYSSSLHVHLATKHFQPFWPPNTFKPVINFHSRNCRVELEFLWMATYQIKCNTKRNKTNWKEWYTGSFKKKSSTSYIYVQGQRLKQAKIRSTNREIKSMCYQPAFQIKTLGEGPAYLLYVTRYGVVPI